MLWCVLLDGVDGQLSEGVPDGAPLCLTDGLVPAALLLLNRQQAQGRVNHVEAAPGETTIGLRHN